MTTTELNTQIASSSIVHQSPSPAASNCSSTLTQAAQANAMPNLQTTDPMLSTEIAAPTVASNPTLPSPRVQHARITTSDFCLTSEPSLSATLGNWSPSSTIFSSSQNHSDPTEGENKRQSITQRLFERSWIQPTIGITTLLVTLIALFVYSHRSFVMAKWTEENDMLQACAQLIDVYTLELSLMQSSETDYHLGTLKWHVPTV